MQPNNLYEQIVHFRDIQTLLPKVIVIYGPTACGKTALSLEVARILNTEIISTDSRQVYRYMDIGTGKITEPEMQSIPHHMLGVIDPDTIFSVVDFVEMSLPMIASLHQQGKIPILCGGTGLYIDGLLHTMGYPDTKPDWQYREELETIRQTQGNETLWKMLESIDPEYAHELGINNHRYIMRALEVWRATGQSKRESIGKKETRFHPLFLTPYTDSPENRKNLYDTIDHRVESMFQSGLTEEVQNIMNIFGDQCPGVTTIGYREVVSILHGEISEKEGITLVQQHSRNYAKRQITWNKRYG